MKNILLFIAVLSVPALVSGMIFQRQTQPVSVTGKFNYPVISERGGPVFLHIAISTRMHERSKRKPMNLSIVIDRSGSMGDRHKLEYVKEAFRKLVRQLHYGDILSVVVYDDRVTVLRPSAMIGDDLRRLTSLIDDVEPGGSTNLGGGLLESLNQADHYASNEYINRVILLSDGLANVGVTDPAELNRMTKKYRRHSIAVSTMGVGLEYNENLMMSLAESGGGNYYFIEHPNSLVSIVREEMNLASSVFAQNAFIQLHLGHDIRIDEVIGFKFNRQDNIISIPVGDLYSNDIRELTIALNLPEGTGTRTIVTGELCFGDSDLKKIVRRFSSSVRYSNNGFEIEKKHNLDIQAKADIAVSTKKVDEAMEAMDNGNTNDAERHLVEAESLLKSSPALSAFGASGDQLREQINRTASYRQTMKDTSDLRKVKKSIQYDNYKAQKRK
ncbi:MAG: VWA domain-containing protein [Bacteroidota bacterium]|jgi:Ca-activated chloride channel family protein